MKQVLIKESFDVDAKVLGIVNWFENPISPSNHTLAAAYMFNSVTGEEQLLEYAYVPDAIYRKCVY